MVGILKKIFGTQQTRLVKKYFRTVKKINAVEETLQGLSNEELQAKTVEFRARLQKGETTDDLLVEAYAVVKNACRRLVGTEVHIFGYNQRWDMIPYDVQLVGGIAMHHGAIAEMQTGEGKTLTAALPLYLHALTGKPTHLVTVNDYLAKRDSEWIGTVFRFLGLTVKALTEDVRVRKELYKADIVYGTASEFGFDYLRDNSMATHAYEESQRGHYFAIIDEIDSILIDEARTPLIISGPTNNSRQMYDKLEPPVTAMVKLQRDMCNKLASEARKTIEQLGFLTEEESSPKLTKQAQEELSIALKNLWIVSKGIPNHKVLKRLREHPDLRTRIDNLETYYWADPNKEERFEALSQLYIVIDERNSDYELTDKGIKAWEGDGTEFTMLDLGHEYAEIDSDKSLSETTKMEKKIALREDDANRKEKAHNIRQLFRAQLLMEKDIDYIVDNGKIVIIDENTGRPQPGRRFSDGLHQAIEAKEGALIQKETQTYATITLQNYFRLYERIAGMTGTATTEAREFKEIYKIDVLEIPTHRKCVRTDSNDEVYMTEREKYNAILKEILEVNGQGRPILIGTESVEISEKLSRILKGNKLEHNVLNAKNHAKEAEIISLAGQRGAITVATNMAGRGTDIKLGEGVASLGGLHVIGTSRHQSRRIDRQLRGRCARQGDPGSSKFYVSFEDSLMRLFAGARINALIQKHRPPEGEAVSARILDRAIETAQKRIEQRNYTMRKHTLEYDDVMNKHRGEVYTFRREILHAENPLPLAYDILETYCSLLATPHFINKQEEGGWETESYRQTLLASFPVSLEEGLFERENYTQEEIETIASQRIVAGFKEKLKRDITNISSMQTISSRPISPLLPLFDVLRSLMVSSVDRHWQHHLLAIDHLRTEVSMRTVAQKDPLLEFKHEAFLLFERFSKNVKADISRLLFSFAMLIPDAPHIQRALAQAQLLGVRPDLTPIFEEL
jgi:preprotein translocase subunit SecA